MSILSKLFGGGGGEAQETKPETYKGFSIIPTPVREGSRYRLSAKISKDIDGETKEHVLIRADVLDDVASANEAGIAKAKQVIDEQGDRLFN